MIIHIFVQLWLLTIVIFCFANYEKIGVKEAHIKRKLRLVERLCDEWGTVMGIKDLL